MSRGLGKADHIIIQTEDGEEYQFAVNDFTITIDRDYEEYSGVIPVTTRQLTETTATLEGQIVCTKSP